MEPLHNADPVEVEKWWKEYYVFTFVRNPWARFLSGQYMLKLMRDKRIENPECNWELKEVCHNPTYIGYQCLKNNTCCHINPQFEWQHVQEQAKCMFGKGGLSAVDFIGRSEESEEDFASLINIINKRKSPDLPEIKIPEELIRIVPWPRKKDSPVPNPDMDQYVKDYKNNPECIEAVYRSINRDFEWLKFPKV